MKCQALFSQKMIKNIKVLSTVVVFKTLSVRMLFVTILNGTLWVMTKQADLKLVSKACASFL